MTIDFSKEQRSEITASLKRYFADELDHDLSEIQAGFLLEYFLIEIAPLAYNRGVEDARKHLVSAAEDLPGICFHEALNYWKGRGGKREVRRKPAP